MFVYFDQNGTLKEIISDKTFRVGDSKRDKIYVYWDGEHSPISGWVKYRKPDGTDYPVSVEECFYQFGTNKLVGKELPTKPLRNLKYFSYDHTYEEDGVQKVGYKFYEITVPDAVLNVSNDDEKVPTQNNMIVARVRFVMDDGTIEGEIDEADSIEALGAIVFAVETNIGILTDSSINESQYNYLISLMSMKLGINILSQKVKELPSSGVAGTIYYVESDDGGIIYDAYFWNGTQFVFLGTTSYGIYTKQEGEDFEIAIQALWTTELNDYKALMNSNWAQYQASLNDQIESFGSLIQAAASGSPKGTYQTLTALQNAYPNGTSGIYIVIADGKWYYWNSNSSAWTAGGMYLSTGGSVPGTRTIGGIDLQDDITTSELLDAVGNSNSKVVKLVSGSDYSVSNGAYIKNDGTNSPYATTSILTLNSVLHKGETIIFKSVGADYQSAMDNVQVLALYEKRVLMDNSTLILNKKIVPLGHPIYPDGKVYSYTATRDGEWIKICGKTEELTSFGVYKLTPVENNYKYIDNLLTLKWHQNTYIYSDNRGKGFNANASNNDTLRSEIITLYCGDILHIAQKNNAFGSVKTCKFTCETNNDATKLVREIVTGSLDISVGEEYEKTYQATKDVENIIVFIEKPLNSYAFIWVERKNQELQANKIFGQLSANEYISSIFRRIICVGDSITQGIVNYVNESSQQISMTSEANYPKFLAQLGNWKVKNAGDSGSNPKTWWNNGIKERYDFSKYECCLIALGINGGLTDTIDEDTTISAGQDYNNYADTNTGRYCSLIEYIQAQNPNIKIFLQKYDIGGGETGTTNTVIGKIAEKYNLPIINWFNQDVVPLINSYFYDYAVTDWQSLHYNGQGYLAIAKLIVNQLTKEVLGNPTKYQLDKEFVRKTDDYNFFNEDLPTEEGLYLVKATNRTTYYGLTTSSYEYVKIPNPPTSGTATLKVVNGTFTWVKE